MDVPISVVIQAYNEEPQLPALFESLKGITDIHLINHESTDKTAEIAESLGAKVYTVPTPTTPATEKDVNDFEFRFGFKPSFTAGDAMMDSVTGFEYLKTLPVKNEWLFTPDCDEIVTWDLEKVASLLPYGDIISCDFHHSHHPDKTPAYTFPATKLYRKDKVWYQGRIHGAILGYDTRVTHAPHDVMYMDHWQIPKDERKSTLPTLEFSMIREGDNRTNYYLAREYFNAKEFEKCIQFFKIFMKMAWNEEEIIKAYTLISASYWALGREYEAWFNCFEAMRKDPTSKEPFLMMADMSMPKHKGIWKAHADIAPNP